MVLARENDINMREFHIKLEPLEEGFRENSMEVVVASREGEVMNNTEDRGRYCSKGDDDGWEGQVGHGHAVGGGGGRHCEE